MSNASVVVQLLFNGILLGSTYGVAAIGLALIFGTMEIIFVAQGAVMILAAYTTFFLFEVGGVDPFLGLLVVVPVFSALGYFLYRFIFRWANRGGKNASLLTAFGLMILLENLMAVLWTPNTRAVRTAYTGLGFPLLGAQIPLIRLAVFALTLGAGAAVSIWLRKTVTGKAVRAATEDGEIASLLGIYPDRVKAITFGIGLGLAGLAGNAVASIYPFDPHFGFAFSLKALIAVALGGIGSVSGALVGGIILGVLESIGAYALTGVWADAVSYGMFLFVLLVLPQGLFARRARVV